MTISKSLSSTEPKHSDDNRIVQSRKQLKKSKGQQMGKDESKKTPNRDLALKEGCLTQIDKKPPTPFASGDQINGHVSEHVYHCMPRSNHSQMPATPTYSPNANHQMLPIPVAAHHQQPSTWHPNVQNRTSTDKVQPSLPSNPPDREIVLMKQSNISQNENMASHNASQHDQKFGSYNFSRNPQFSSLIQSHNVLCRQLEQLTDHNIHLATQNSKLRSELEQSKEDNLRMIHIRQIQAQQACKQAADFENLLSKYEKSGTAIRKLQQEGGNTSNKINTESNNFDTKEALEVENNLLRIRIQDLQEKNKSLGARVDELTSIIEGAGNLLHSQKLSKTEKNAIVAPPPLLKRNETNDLTHPLPNNSQVTNEVSLPFTVTKRAVTINNEDDNAAALPTNGTNRQVTNENTLPPSMNHMSKVNFPLQAHLSNRSTPKFEKKFESYNDLAPSHRYSSKHFEDIATQHYQAQMDETFSVSAEHSRFINLRNEDSKNKMTSKRDHFILKSPNLETDGDLKDEDEVSSDDDAEKIEKDETSSKSSRPNSIKGKNNNSEHKEYPYFIGSNLYDARLAMSRKRTVQEREEKEPKSKDDYSKVSSTNNAITDKNGIPKSCNKKPVTGESNPNENSTTKRKRGRPKRDKSEGWPKRPLSAYNLFFKEQRIKILETLTRADEEGDENDEEKEKEISSPDCADDKPKRGRPFGSGRKRRRSAPHGIITFEKLGKRISIDWKEAANEVKEKYRLQAAANLKKYQQDLEIFLKNKGIKDSNGT